MTFWSGETLAERLPGLIDTFEPTKIDCASYRLALGGQAFITSDLRLDDTPNKGLRMDLEMGQQCRIPPGQFAFLLTEERVVVPKNALAFISMRAKYKFRGLINVSGFHVDPGWNGHLIFGVYNSGPTPIILSRGTDLFLIWFADLDVKETKYAKNIIAPLKSLPDDLMEQMTGQVFSPVSLAKDVSELKETADELKQSISDSSTNLRLELVELKSEHNFYKKVVWALSGVLLAMGLKYAITGAINELSTPAGSRVESSTKAGVGALPDRGDSSHASESNEKTSKELKSAIESLKAANVGGAAVSAGAGATSPPGSAGNGK
jgi:dCTP deaminase